MDYGPHDFRPGVPRCPACGHPGRLIADLDDVMILECRRHRHPRRFYAEPDTGSNPPLAADGTRAPRHLGPGHPYEPALVAFVLRLRRDEGLGPCATASRAGVPYDVVRRIWCVYALGYDPQKKGRKVKAASG